MMKFIQRILSHSLLIAVAVIVTLAWVYRADIMPERFGTQAKAPPVKAVENTDSKAAGLERIEPEQKVTVATQAETGSSAVNATPASDLPPMAAEESNSDLPPMAATETNSEFPPMEMEDSRSDLPPMASAAGETESSELPPMAPVNEPGTDSLPPRVEAKPETSGEPNVGTDTSGAAESVTDSVSAVADVEASNTQPKESTATVVATLQPNAVQAPVYRPVDSGSQPEPETVNSESAAEDHSPTLAAARQAFWQHDLDAAEQYYRDLSTQSPDDADIMGELGNLYFQQGRWEQAADAYLNAGKVLAEQGQGYRSAQLLRVLWGIDPDKARQLEMSLAQQQP